MMMLLIPNIFLFDSTDLNVRSDYSALDLIGPTRLMIMPSKRIISTDFNS